MKLLDLLTSNLKWIAIVVLGFIVLMGLKQCSDKDAMKQEIAMLKRKNQSMKNNIKVMSDTMEFWVDKAGNYKSEISILTADKDMLEEEFQEFQDKYKEVVGKEAKDRELIAYLENEIRFKDEVLAGLNTPGSGASISLDSSQVDINIEKRYDSTNYYKIAGYVKPKLVNNKIVDGEVKLSPEFAISLALAMDKDKDGIVHITSSTKFPAQVTMSGINMIEQQLNTTYKGYLGIGFNLGYGLSLGNQKQMAPYVGVGLTYMPSWLTLKIGKNYK